MKNNNYSKGLMASTLLAIYYIVSFNPTRYFNLDSLVGSFQIALFRPIPQLMIGFLGVYCLSTYVKSCLLDNPSELSDDFYKVYWGGWFVTNMALYYLNFQYEWGNMLSSAEILSIISLVIVGMRIIIVAIEFFMIYKVIKLSKKRQIINAINTLFLISFLWRFILVITDLIGINGIRSNFIMNFIASVVYIAVYIILSLVFKELINAREKEFRRNHSEVDFKDVSNYTPSELKSKCDSCNAKISNREWSKASLFRGKLICRNCGTIYQMQFGKNIISKIICIVLPMFLINHQIIKFISIFVLCYVVSEVSNKSWYQIKKR